MTVAYNGTTLDTQTMYGYVKVTDKCHILLQQKANQGPRIFVDRQLIKPQYKNHNFSAKNTTSHVNQQI